MKLQLVFVSLLISTSLFAQSKFDFSVNESCSYFGEKVETDVYGFESSSEAIGIIDEILGSVGLERNFEIKSANVPNAAAIINGSTRYILYSENFIHEVNQKTGSKWAAISILAHEIGHHLNGHTLDEIGSRPTKELEADKFCGFALAKIGATLEEAQMALKMFGSNSGSSTHPPKGARLEAVAVGYRKAKESQTGTSTRPISSTSKPQSKRLSDAEIEDLLTKWCRQHFRSCFGFRFVKIKSIDVDYISENQISVTGTNTNTGYDSATHTRRFEAEITLAGNNRATVFFNKQGITWIGGETWTNCTESVTY